MNSLPLLLLFVYIFVTVICFIRDKKSFDAFMTSNETEDRQNFYRAWTIEPFVIYGLIPILCMIVLGNFSDLFKPPDFLIPVSLQIDAFGIDKEIPSFFIGFISALKHLVLPFFLVGLPLLIIVSRYLEGINEGKGDSQKKTRESTRKVSALIPRNYKERCWGFWLSMNAGFSEEIFFRLFAPTLIYTVTGSTLLAICLSTLWFGLAHYYQGFVGVLATTLIGFVLFFIYLYTRSLWLVMLVHVIIDINSLVLDPWLKEYFEKNA